MKCALDLQIIAQTRAREITAQEEERRRQEREALRKETIQFCESLGETLEKQANNGNSPTVSFYLDTTNGTVLRQTWDDYADGRMSYESTGTRIDIGCLAEWFHQYCFKVSSTKCEGWRYCWGRIQFQQITIKPDPQCLS